ncbi:MAG TPA: TlpA disulfide reductase family protein [Pyrinomonadaceae bacterium]|nr:TlpA disulfide reductase family protein [Pyrinomonadaceae bacterium]
MSIRISIALAFLLFPIYLAAQPQSGGPILTIAVKDGTYSVRGIVGTEADRRVLLELIRNELGIMAPDIEVNHFVSTFPSAWEESIAADLKKVKTWRSGIYRWGRDPQAEEREFAKYLASVKVQEVGLAGPSKLVDPGKKITIINLTATWTGPSRVELPKLQQLYDSYKSAGLDIVTLTVDEEDSLQVMKEFAGELGLRFRVGIAPETLTKQAFRVSRFQGIPQNFVFANGVIVLVTRGVGKAETENLRSVVEKMLQ